MNIVILHLCVEEKKVTKRVNSLTIKKKGQLHLELSFSLFNVINYSVLISSLIALYSAEPVLPKRTYISRIDCNNVR